MAKLKQQRALLRGFLILASVGIVLNIVKTSVKKEETTDTLTSEQTSGASVQDSNGSSASGSKKDRSRFADEKETDVYDRNNWWANRFRSENVLKAISLPLQVTNLEPKKFDIISKGDLTSDTCTAEGTALIGKDEYICASKDISSAAVQIYQDHALERNIRAARYEAARYILDEFSAPGFSTADPKADSPAKKTAGKFYGDPASAGTFQHLALIAHAFAYTQNFQEINFKKAIIKEPPAQPAEAGQTAAAASHAAESAIQAAAAATEANQAAATEGANPATESNLTATAEGANPSAIANPSTEANPAAAANQPAAAAATESNLTASASSNKDAAAPADSSEGQAAAAAEESQPTQETIPQENLDQTKIVPTVFISQKKLIQQSANGTQLLLQLQKAQNRGSPNLPVALWGAPDWVAWNCYDAMNPNLNREATQKGWSSKHTKRIPFCGVGRSGSNPQNQNKNMAFARQEAMDVLIENILFWLKSQSFIRAQYSGNTLKNPEQLPAYSSDRTNDRPINMQLGFEGLAAVLEEKIQNIERPYLIEKTWRSSDDEHWHLVAIEDTTFFTLLGSTGLLPHQAERGVFDEMTAEFKRDINARAAFFGSPKQNGKAEWKSGSDNTDCASLVRFNFVKALYPSYHNLFSKSVCATIPIPWDELEGTSSKNEKSEENKTKLEKKYASKLHKMLTDIVWKEAVAKDTPTGELNLARLSLENMLSAHLPETMIGFPSSDIHSWVAHIPFIYGGMPVETINEVLHAVNFFSQVRNRKHRLRLKTSYEQMEGAPNWVMWTCFEALNFGGSDKTSEALYASSSPNKRYPYCLVSNESNKALEKSDQESLYDMIADNIIMPYIRHKNPPVTMKVSNEYQKSNVVLTTMEERQVQAAIKDEQRRAQETREANKALEEPLKAALRKSLKAVHKKLKKDKWKDGYGRVWHLIAIDEATMLKAIENTPNLGPEAVEYIKTVLPKEYEPFYPKRCDEDNFCDSFPGMY